MLLTRKKADKELSASADSFSHTAANSHFPCAPTTGRQLQIGSRRLRETVLVVFKNGWQNEAFPVKSFADVRHRHTLMLTSHQSQKLFLTTLLPPTPHNSGKETSVPLPKIQWWGQGG